MNKRTVLAFVLTCLCISGVYAAQDPIGWKIVGPSLPAKTVVNQTYQVTYQFISNFPYTMKKPLHIVQHASSPEFTLTDACSGIKLKPKQTCQVIINFTPTTAGKKSTRLVEKYAKNVVPLPKLTTITSGTAPGCQVTGQTILPLPTNSYQYADNVVKFVFTNQCATSSATLGPVTFTPTAGVTKGSATSNPSQDTCSGSTLTAMTSCTVYASVIPQAAGLLTVVASVSYTTDHTDTASTSTHANITIVPSSTHRLVFVNQCPFPVWYGIANGSGGTPPACRTHITDAPYVNTINSPDPTPSNARTPNDYKLGAQIPNQVPTVKTLMVSAYTNGLLWARTGCSNSGALICATGTCDTIPNTGTCKPGSQPGNPVTRFEAFLTNCQALTGISGSGDGIYNTSIINGSNVPVEVKALGNGSLTNTSTTPPFDCGASGALIQPTGSTLGSCPWSFTPPSSAPLKRVNNFYWVSAGPDDGCTDSSQCTLSSAGHTCGMAYDSVANTGGNVPINRRCGNFLGYWTLTDFVNYSGSQWGSVNLYNIYNFATQLTPVVPASGNYGYSNTLLPHGTVPAIYADMYGCAPTSQGATPNPSANISLLSGYTAGNTNVCGCYDWDQAGSVMPTAQAAGATCVTHNPTWENQSGDFFPQIKWLKEACPTAYSYPWDDKSSSFQCNPTQGGFTSYQVTFCPGGKTGAPNT